MKSKSTSFILVAVALVVVGVLVYFFVFKGDDSATESTGLVSTTTGQAQGLATNVATENATGSQVVAILRNLTAIKLDDSVFKNPAFARLNDNSITLLPPTNQGRRNPFAPVDAGANAQAQLPGGF